MPPTKSLCSRMLAGHSGWAMVSAARHLPLQRQQVADAEDLVDHAGAVPQDHLAAGDFLQVLAQVPVGHEQDLVVRAARGG